MNDKTLKKYGLTWDDYHQMMVRQRGDCPICKRPLPNPVVDHQHVKGWKTMKPAKRKKHVRGLLCRRCNWRFLGNLVTVEIACSVADYLLDFKDRSADISR